MQNQKFPKPNKFSFKSIAVEKIGCIVSQAELLYLYTFDSNFTSFLPSLCYMFSLTCY